jgi:nitroreductase
MMTRRQFVTSAAAALAVPAFGRATETPRARPGPAAPPTLDPGLARLLGLAALAPSSHNVQPWTVRVASRRELELSIAAERRLPEVDPDGRELVLSVGCFLENLAQASAAEGFDAEVTPGEAMAQADVLARVRLVQAQVRPGATEHIRRRRTLRSGHLPRPLAAADAALLVEAAGPGTVFFPRGSPAARAIAEATVEAMRQQTWRDPSQRELSRWIRFRDEEVARRGDGLTVASMEASALAGFVMQHFFDEGSVMGRSFREKGIELCQRQADEGAGFLVVTSADAQLPALLDAGRRFERMALLVRERAIAAHPMSQALEEAPWRDRLAAALGLSRPIQFLVRVGYVDRYPEPVSPRRALTAFVAA